MVSYLIDAVLAVMLVTATVYLIVVNKRLKMLRDGQSEINALVSSFSRSIDDTDASMKRLVASATDIATSLSGDMDRAKGVKEEMSLLLGSCERISVRMEESLRHARGLLRRLDEGAMSPLRPRPPAPPVRMAPERVATVGAEPGDRAATPEPATPSDGRESPAEADDGDGFRELDLPLRATAADRTMASAEVTGADAAEGASKAAINAFYARLRAVGSEG